MSIKLMCTINLEIVNLKIVNEDENKMAVPANMSLGGTNVNWR